jgi:hypothetical protein
MTKTGKAMTPLAAILGLSAITQPAVAKDRPNKDGYTVLNTTTVESAKADDLFIRKDGQGHTYLYVIYANNTLAVFDVTDARKVKETKHLTLTEEEHVNHARPLNVRQVLVGNAAAAEHELALIDTADPPLPRVVQQFRDADCYTVNAMTQTVYVVQRGKLKVIQFDGPVTRDAEHFEQAYEAR